MKDLEKGSSGNKQDDRMESVPDDIIHHHPKQHHHNRYDFLHFASWWKPVKESSSTHNAEDTDYIETNNSTTKAIIGNAPTTVDTNITTCSTETNKSKWIFTSLILLLGSGASAAFLSLGITALNNDINSRFNSDAEDLIVTIKSAWDDYEMFGLWIHESCHKSYERNYNIDPNINIAGHLGYCTRNEFQKLYEHINSVNVDFQSMQFMVNITNDVRNAFEQEAKIFYETYYNDTVQYRGITEVRGNESGSVFTVPRSESDIYFPIHYVLPVKTNEQAIEIDTLAAKTANVIKDATETWKPRLSQRIKLVQEKDPDAYGIVLIHPGVPTSIEEDAPKPNKLAQIVIRIPSFFEHALRSTKADKSVYLFDSTDTENPATFLGGVCVQVDEGKKPIFTSKPEINDMSEIYKKHKNWRHYEEEINIANRKWTISVISNKYNAKLIFVILGGIIIFIASVFFAIWFNIHHTRVTKLNALRSKAELEKAQIAHVQAMRERELNEFIAHEVRNPLSSAISALSFVSTGVADSVNDEKCRKSIMDDVAIMDASLQFINELLRNMLDIHRAAGKQIKLDFSETDIEQDILQPVAAILFMRGAKVDIQVQCPKGLGVKSDRMRLKQIILNLAANATKFVQQGYILLKADLDESGCVEIIVEDSGPGIPVQKRGRLFAKFQESLDSLNQGTGIGLCVCKNLSELMGADILLDEEFNSGIEGCPGTRFILRLNQPALHLGNNLSEEDETLSQTASSRDLSLDKEKIIISSSYDTLPESLSVLLVDDDTMIRKMLTRALHRVAPKWDIDEACNGETALRIVDSKQFDIIFLDQYMASIEKQLLGTETARAIRSKGVKSLICGLSANDMKLQFLEAGADAFMIKPFPCEKNALSRELVDILNKSNS